VGAFRLSTPSWSCRASWVAALLVLNLSAPAPAIELPVLDFRAIVRVEGLVADCAVTFDDGPGPHTATLLDHLRARAVRATFFVVGEHVRRQPDLIRRMLAEGHEVENHSYDHPDMRRLSEPERQREIALTEALLESLGAKPRFFRPPYGAYDAALVEDARAQGLEIVLWSHDSEDWRYHTAATLEGNILPAASQGAHGIFLFHDIQQPTVAAMPAILDDLRARGCRFVTVLEWVEDSRARLPAMPVPTTTPAAGLKIEAGWVKPGVTLRQSPD
jgi:peptidoglycan/xylan/chitin deacetylase (PgdA/CDA1 family)